MKHVPPLPPINYSRINWRVWAGLALLAGFWLEVFMWI